MNFFVFVIVAMGIGWLWWVCAAGMKHSERKLKLEAQAQSGGETYAKLAAELAQTRTELARVLERVAVLERLATDGDRDLSREIENLKRGNAPRPGV